jgi:hypothetical protein
MAGDWIKVEKVSSHKPEVLKIARMLGVSRQHAFGLLVEFWSWLDSNCVDGVVDGVVDADVDALMSCDGLSSLLTLVGWVQFDVDPMRMRVLNFDRHNGESSKNRALKSERQAKWRAKSVDAHVDATPSTREEKRIVNTERERVSAPTEEHRILAAKLNLDCEVEWLKYRDQQANAPRKHSDLQAGFRNWLRRAKEFQPQGRAGPAKQEARAKVAAQIFGATNERVGERVIDGEVERVA